MTPPRDVTLLLHELASGQANGYDDLFSLVYDELRRIAHSRLRQARRGGTLNTTALVHEAYLRLIDQTRVAWNDRAHFFALAARAMRFVLIDYARKQMAVKRGGDRDKIALDGIQVAAEARAADVLALDEALVHLEQFDERLARLVEYRFFAGLTYEEIAEVTGRSTATVKRDWRRARAWLYEMMKEEEGDSLRS